jgi:uncharacterized protein (TIGR02246 family)
VKIVIFGFFLPLLCASCLNAQVKSDATEESAIENIVERWKDGYNDGQASRVAALYAEDAYYLTQHYVSGIIHGRAAIRAYIQRGVDAQYRIDSIKTVLLERSGDFAYAITRYYSTNGGRRDFGVNLVVLKKVAGTWLIVAHEAAVPDPATAVKHLDIPEQR